MQLNICDSLNAIIKGLIQNDQCCYQNEELNFKDETTAKNYNIDKDLSVNNIYDVDIGPEKFFIENTVSNISEITTISNEPNIVQQLALTYSPIQEIHNDHHKSIKQEKPNNNFISTVTNVDIDNQTLQSNTNMKFDITSKSDVTIESSDHRNNLSNKKKINLKKTKRETSNLETKSSIESRGRKRLIIDVNFY